MSQLRMLSHLRSAQMPSTPCLVYLYPSFAAPNTQPSSGRQPSCSVFVDSSIAVSIATFHLQLFLKEHLHQLLESMRERVQNRAALTLQRYLRGFFIQRRFRSLRRKIILLQSRARGFLAR